jgi:anti-anti-sigma regulatory factor
MVALRTFQLGGETSLVAVRGELDDAAAGRARDEVTRCLQSGVVIVDLLNVWLATDTALAVMLPALRRSNVTVVADSRVLDRLDVPFGLRLLPTLASALGT